MTTAAMSTKGLGGKRMPVREPQYPQSKRWQTTMQSALEEVQARRKPGDRGEMIQVLADRKKSNHKTSISFGHEKVNYSSDAMDNQKFILNATNADTEAQRLRIKKMKSDLTTTNFKLGDARDKTVYETTNQLAMLQVVQHPMDAQERAEKAELNRSMKEAVKRSSLEFGTEPVLYESVMTGQMRREPTSTAGVDFEARRKEIGAMTYALRKHNFSLGDASEPATWETDSHSGYGSLPPEAYRYRHDHRDEIAKHIADSRSSHYSLSSGPLDPSLYKSATHLSMERVYDRAAGSSMNTLRLEEMERARAMKANLTKTTFVLGDDSEYM